MKYIIYLVLMVAVVSVVGCTTPVVNPDNPTPAPNIVVSLVQQWWPAIAAILAMFIKINDKTVGKRLYEAIPMTPVNSGQNLSQLVRCAEKCAGNDSDVSVQVTEAETSVEVKKREQQSE